MTRSLKPIAKKKGRPATGKDPMLTFRAPPDLTVALDVWIAAQPEPKPSRSDAIRRLLAEALGKGADAGTIAGEDLNASNDD